MNTRMFLTHITIQSYNQSVFMTLSEHFSRLDTKNYIVGLSAVIVLRVNAFCPSTSSTPLSKRTICLQQAYGHINSSICIFPPVWWVNKNVIVFICISLIPCKITCVYLCVYFSIVSIPFSMHLFYMCIFIVIKYA